MPDNYFIHLLISICIYTILALSLQLSVGFSGLLNLGHVAFFAIGAYTYALLIKLGFPYLLVLALAGVIPLAFGYLLSLPTNKLKGDVLAIVTLGFSYLTYNVLSNWHALTGGPSGITDITRPIFFSISFEKPINFLMLTLLVTALTYIFLKIFVDSYLGKIIQATRDDELSAQVLGKNTYKAKSISLATAAFWAGIAGASFIDPNSFAFSNIILLLTIIILGGLASLEGTILATIILILLPEPLRFLNISSSVIGPARQIIFAILLLLIIRFQPKGFYGKIDFE